MNSRRADGSAATFSMREMPWHQLAAVLDAAPLLAQVFELCGALFRAERRRLYVESGVDGSPSPTRAPLYC
jgi:hypothetical protein